MRERYDGKPISHTGFKSCPTGDAMPYYAYRSSVAVAAWTKSHCTVPNPDEQAPPMLKRTCFIMFSASPGPRDLHSASTSTRTIFTYLYKVAPARLHKFALALFLGCLSVSEFDVFRRNMLQHNSTASFVILVCFAFQPRLGI